MTEYGVDIRVTVDDRAVKQLQALPDDIRERFGRLQKDLQVVPGPPGEVGTAALGRAGGVAAEAFGAGRIAPEQAREIKANLDLANKALRVGYQDRLQAIRSSRDTLEKEVRGLWESWEKADKTGQKKVADALQTQLHERGKQMPELVRQEQEAALRLRQVRQEALASLGIIGLGVAGLPGAPGAPPGAPPGAGAGGLGGVVGGALLGRGVFAQFARGLFGIGMMGGFGYYGAQRFREAAAREVSVFDLARRLAPAEAYTLPAPGGEKEDREAWEALRRRLIDIRFLKPDEAIRTRAAFTARAGGLGGRSVDLSGQAALFGLGFGVGPETGGQFFGQMARLGVGRTAEDQRRLAMLIGEAVVQAQMRGREGEVFDTLTTFMELTMQRMAGAPDPRDILALQARLALGAPEGPERVGMMGALGMRILGPAHEAIAGTDLFPDLPNLMRPVLLSVMARAGVRDPWQMQMLAEQGLLARLPGKEGKPGRLLVEAVLEEGERFGPGMGKLLASRKWRGLPLQFFERLRTMGTAGEFEKLPEPVREAWQAVPAHRQQAAMDLIERFLKRDETTGAPIGEAELFEKLRQLAGPFEATAEKFQERLAAIDRNLDATFTRMVPAFTGFTGWLEKGSGALEKFTGWVERAAKKTGLPPEVAGGIGVGAGMAAVGASIYGLWKLGLRPLLDLGGQGVAAGAGAVGELASRFPGLRGFSFLGPVGAALSLGGSEDPGVREWRRQQWEREHGGGPGPAAPGPSRDRWWLEPGALPGGAPPWEMRWERDMGPMLEGAAPPAAREGLPTPSSRDRWWRESRSLPDLVRAAAARHGVPEALIWSVIGVESRGDPRAKGKRGEIGLMQIRPETAGLPREALLSPEVNIEAGTRHLAHLLREFRGDTEKAIAAYNAGQGGVEQALRRARTRGVPWESQLPKGPGYDAGAYLGRVLAELKGGGAGERWERELGTPEAMSPEAMKEALRLRVSVTAEPLTIFVRKDSGETEVHRVRLTVSEQGAQLGHGDKWWQETQSPLVGEP